MSDADVFLSFALLRPLQRKSFHYSQSKGVYLSSTKAIWEIGRGSRSDEPKDVWVHHERLSASAKHAVLTRDADGQVMIEDCSRYGTWLQANGTEPSGKRVQPREPAVKVTGLFEVRDGWHIWLGPPGESTSCGFEFVDVFARSVFLSTYGYERWLGSGSFGRVCKVFSRADPSKSFAVKIIDYSPSHGTSSRYNCLKEVQLLKLASSHPGICPLIEHFDDEITHKFYLVLEYLPSGNLQDYYANRAPATPHVTAVVMKQMLEAVAHLHHNDIVHRDIKPDNVLIKSMNPIEVAISDLGLARQSRLSSQMHSRTGTLLYMAPEVFAKGGDFSSGYTRQVDCWSVALTGFHILIGIKNRPWSSGFHDAKNPRLDWGRLRDREISAEGLLFFESMLRVDPKARWSIQAALESAWMSKVSTKRPRDRLLLPGTVLAHASSTPAPSARPQLIEQAPSKSSEAVLKAMETLYDLPPLEPTSDTLPQPVVVYGPRRSPRGVAKAKRGQRGLPDGQ